MLMPRVALAIAKVVELYLHRVGKKDLNSTSGVLFESGLGIYVYPSYHWQNHWVNKGSIVSSVMPPGKLDFQIHERYFLLKTNPPPSLNSKA